jgi:selenocysteine-specific elongation factor
VAVNLPDVQPEEVERGALLAAPGTATPGNVLDVEVRWLAHAAAPLARASGLTFHLGAGRAVAEVRADAPIPPGGTGTARVRLDRVLALAPGARFVLRGPPDLRHGAVVGGGRVLDAAPPRRREAAVRAALAADPLAVGVLVAEAGERGIAPQTIAARLPVAPRPPGPPLFAASTLAAAADRIVAAVAAWHAERPLDPGMPRARAGEGPLPDAAVERAVAEGRLVREGPILRAPEHEATLDEESQALARKLLRAIGKAGLAGPRVVELEERFPAPAAQIRDVLAHLERTGRIVRADAFCFPGREARELRRRAAAAVLAGEALGVGWLKEAAGLTRRHAVPLFGWLDACGATRRVGDVRVAGPKAAAFASQPG